MTHQEPINNEPNPFDPKYVEPKLREYLLELGFNETQDFTLATERIEVSDCTVIKLESYDSARRMINELHSFATVNALGLKLLRRVGEVDRAKYVFAFDSPDAIPASAPSDSDSKADIFSEMCLGWDGLCMSMARNNMIVEE